MTLPNKAIARVKALDDAQLVGAAEIVSIFEMYGYRRDQANQNLWWLNDGTESPGASIEVLDDGEALVIFSRSRENAGNVNHIARQAGWLSCELTSLDDDANELMLESLLQVEPVSDRITILSGAGAGPMQAEVTAVRAAEIAAPASGPAPSVPAALPSGITIAGDEPLTEVLAAGLPAVAVNDESPSRGDGLLTSDDELLADMHANFDRIESLTQQLAASESAREDVEMRNHELARELQALQGRSELAAASPRSERESVLMGIVETHLLSLVDTSKLDSDPLVQQLKQSGFEVVVKLAHAA